MIEEQIQKILAVIESKFDVIAYAYKDTCFWMIAISDIDLYLNDKKFKTLCNAWRQLIRNKYRQKLIFCACTPIEDKLAKLLEEDNLYMNV